MKGQSDRGPEVDVIHCLAISMSFAIHYYSFWTQLFPASATIYLVSVVVLDNRFASGVVRSYYRVAFAKRHLQIVQAVVFAHVDVIEIKTAAGVQR